MSTRCNVLLRSPDGARVYFYRHTDGYPTMAGARLYHTALAMLASNIKPVGFPWIGDFAKRLLLAHSESGSPLYELTSGPHSDAEYFYILDFPGFTETAGVDDDTDYRKVRDMLLFRWSGTGMGKELEERAAASTPRALDDFMADVWKWAKEREAA